MISNLINGVNADYLAINDRGTHYGDGLFETIACVEGKLQFCSQHLNRLNHGASVLGIEYPGDDAYLSDIQLLLEASAPTNYVVKLLLTRGQGQRGYRSPRPQQVTRIVQISNWPEHVSQFDLHALKLCICHHPVSSNRQLAGIKHLNRLDNVIARNEWQDEYDEGLMTDDAGFIIEGTMSNVFFVRGQSLITPALNKAGIDGIIRQQILDVAKQHNIEHTITQIHKDELDNMDEVFVCNSLMGISSVSAVMHRSFIKNELTTTLSRHLQQQIMS